MKNRSYKLTRPKGLLLIILLALVIRIVFFVSLKPWDSEVVNENILVDDAYGYHKLASSVLSNKSFEDFTGWRTPGYPLFIAFIYWISSSSIWLVLFIQIFLNVFSVLIVYKIASIIVPRKIGVLAALLFAIDIHQAESTVTLLTEPLFVFLFLVSIYFLCNSLKEDRLLSICLSALLLGIATLVRPISVYFPIVVICFIFVLSNFKLKMKFVYSLLFSIFFIVTITPWLIHNYSKYGIVKLSSVSNVNLLYLNVGYTEVYKTGKTWQEVSKDFDEIAIKQGVDTTNKFLLKNSKIYSKIAINYIKENFTLYCKRHFMGIVNLYTSIGSTNLTSIFHLKSNPPDIDRYGGPGIFRSIVDFFQSRTKAEIYFAIGIGFYLLVNYIFSLYGIFLLMREKEYIVILFILIILYFSVLTGVVGGAQYRIPFMPLINILCAVGLSHFYLILVKILGSHRIKYLSVE